MQRISRRAIITFIAAAAVQALGFPLISRIFGLGDRFQAPSWVVFVLVSFLFALIAESVERAKKP